MSIHFIPKVLVLTIHADLLRRYGGRSGLRDAGLLESALAQPMITVDRKYAHKTIFRKAATYGFHICKNYPFVDGNKRVAFVLMNIFLERNGWYLESSEEDAYEMMMRLASSKMTKIRLSAWLKNHSSKIPRR